MEFLKEILGDELFEQVSSKVNEHNSKEENKDKQVKLANLGTGEYTSTGKYSNLETEHNNTKTQLAEANKLIEAMKKAEKGNDALQTKITDYQTKVETLEAELQQTKVKAALKVALMGAKALDVDYLTFKLNEKLAENGEKLELDENENIKGLKDKIDGLKIQFPTQFETSTNKKIEENKLDKSDDQSGTYTKSDILKMSYQERNKIASEHPEAYEQAMGRA